MSIIWKARIIWGHQDRNPFTILDWWAKLNIEVDQLAQGYLLELQESPSLSWQKKGLGEGWLAWIHQLKVVSHLRETLNKHEQKPKIWERWGKWGYQEEIFNQTAWDANEQVS